MGISILFNEISSSYFDVLLMLASPLILLRTILDSFFLPTDLFLTNGGLCFVLLSYTDSTVWEYLKGSRPALYAILI